MKISVQYVAKTQVGEHCLNRQNTLMNINVRKLRKAYEMLT